MRKLILLFIAAPVALLSQTSDSYKPGDLLGIKPLKKNNRFFKGDDKPTENNVVSKGKSVINLYYGYNLFTGVYKSAAGAAAIGTNVKSLGPVGVVYEYLVTDNVGLGAEVGYSQTDVTYSESYTDYTGTYTVSDELKFTTIRAMFRANIHFTKSEKWDAYFLMSAGYRHSDWSISSTSSNSSSSSSSTSASVSFRFPPFGIKPGLGFRYFFTNNIGLNAELAIGTPVAGGGLSFKF